MSATSKFREFEIQCINGVWMMKFEDVKTLLRNGIRRISEGVAILNPDEGVNSMPDVKGGE